MTPRRSCLEIEKPLTPPSSVVVMVCVLTGVSACSSGAPETGYTLIDDMEGTSGIIEWTALVGSPGSWDSFSDQPGSVLPLPRDEGGVWSQDLVPAPYQTRPGITSTHAARLRTTTPLVNQWGAAMGFDFADLPTLPTSSTSTGHSTMSAVGVDLTAFRGISLWAMASGTGTTTVDLEVDDSNTHPSGGRCDPTATDNPRTACYDSFSFPLDLTGTFTRYTIDFSQLKQAAFGHQTMPSVLTQDNVYGMSFAVRPPGGFCPPTTMCAGALPTLTFDIWIDDLYFVPR